MYVHTHVLLCACIIIMYKVHVHVQCIMVLWYIHCVCTCTYTFGGACGRTPLSSSLALELLLLDSSDSLGTSTRAGLSSVDGVDAEGESPFAAVPSSKVNFLSPFFAAFFFATGFFIVHVGI